MNGWPEPEGLGISPPNEFGIVLYNFPFDPELSILDELDACPPAVSNWHDRAENGSEWADALRLPADVEGEQS